MSADNHRPDWSGQQRRTADADSDGVDYAHRHFINLLSTTILLLLALAMAWTVRALDQQETTRKCFASGRRDCVEVAAPPRDMRQAVR